MSVSPTPACRNFCTASRAVASHSTASAAGAALAGGVGSAAAGGSAGAGVDGAVGSCVVVWLLAAVLSEPHRVSPACAMPVRFTSRDANTIDRRSRLPLIAHRRLRDSLA